jgi:solute carrier family 50 protein (sugar transporter)
VKTALQIIEDKTVHNLSLLPFASLLVNCCIWTFYGLLKNDKTVLYPNLLGILSGGFCFSVFKIYAPPKKELYMNFFVLGLILLSSIIYFDNNAELLGGIGCFIAVLVMGSPLATLSTVIKEKSTASMPFTTSLMTWCNSCSWSLYGYLIANDYMVSVSTLSLFYL